MTRSNRLTYNQVNDYAIFGMNHDQTTYACGMAQHAKDRLIIHHKGVGVGHQELEGRDSRRYHLVHRGFGSIGEVSNGHVKTVIYSGVTIGLLMPGLQGLDEGMPATLVGEIENGG